MTPSKKQSVLPGFGLTMGYTLTYLSLLVLIPLAGLFIKTASGTWSEFFGVITSPRFLSAYRLTLLCSLFAAIFNGIFGLLVAWVLVRYDFPLKKLFNTLIDLPFALPTAVAGITLTALYSGNGFFGQYLTKIGINIVFTPVGITLALIFIGFPFVVRTVEPVLQDLDKDMEEAAACLGASRLQTFINIIFPSILPALLTGVALSFARAIGEYGSIVFISGNMPMRTEIIPLLIITELEQYHYVGATSIAVVMLMTSFVLLFGINIIQWWSYNRQK